MTESTNETPTAPSVHWLLLAAPIAIMAIIFALSSRSQLPDLDGGRDIQNVIGHFSVYAALGAALAVAFRSFGWSAGRVLVAAVVVATLYGVTDELHQSFVPHRNADLFDLLVDFLGALVGSAGMLVIASRRASLASASSGAGRDRPADGSS
jgi:VanZ family protein